MKNKYRNKLIGLLISLPLIRLFSCNVISTPIAPTLVSTQPPVSQGLKLDFTSINETGELPALTLSAQVPELSGSTDPRVAQFNQQMDVLVQQEVDLFNQSLTGLPNPPIGTGSYFDLTFSLVSPWSDILSLKFVVDTYYDGAAHPGQYSKAFTFDLVTGHQVNLDQLFLPGTNYLQVLSDYCKTELTGREIAFDSSVTGADPLPDNYLKWNISADGLVVTFDAYQVAAYAAGAQVVIIPYTALSGIIDSQGPLAIFIQ